jgi:membrane-associated PAP2 superfamily phosphatase
MHLACVALPERGYFGLLISEAVVLPVEAMAARGRPRLCRPGPLVMVRNDAPSRLSSPPACRHPGCCRPAPHAASSLVLFVQVYMVSISPSSPGNDCTPAG